MDNEKHLNMQVRVKNSDTSVNNSEISNVAGSDKINSEKTIVKHLIVEKSVQRENVKKRKAIKPANESAQTRVKKSASANEESRPKTENQRYLPRQVHSKQH